MCLVEYDILNCPQCYAQYRGRQYLPEGMSKCWENLQEGGIWEPMYCPWKLVQSSGIEITLEGPCEKCVESNKRVKQWCDEQESRKRKPGKGGGSGGGGSSSAGGRSSKRSQQI